MYRHTCTHICIYYYNNLAINNIFVINIWFCYKHLLSFDNVLYSRNIQNEHKINLLSLSSFFRVEIQNEHIYKINLLSLSFFFAIANTQNEHRERFLFNKF